MGAVRGPSLRTRSLKEYRRQGSLLVGCLRLAGLSCRRTIELIPWKSQLLRRRSGVDEAPPNLVMLQ